MTATGEVETQFREWLKGVLPEDYAADPNRYRFDEKLHQDYQRAACEAGWLVPQWPQGEGGRDLGPQETVAVRLAAATLRAPSLVNVQSVGVVAPSLRAFGREDQREQYLMPTLFGDVTWALGMSEPSAGSDLASLRTAAKPVDDGFRVSGQKIWCTQAHVSDLVMLFCRTDAEMPKHRGISCLLVDLDSPGITVRVIDTGWPDTDEFCEVFLDDVFVPQERLLGELNGGWTVAMDSLNHERDMIWIENYAAAAQALEGAARAASRHRREDLHVELGRRTTDVAALRLTGMRALENRLNDLSAPEFFTLKLFGSETLQRSIELAGEAAGLEGLTDRHLLLDDFESLGATLYGGTSEIQRNILAERVLGLPRG